MYLYGASGHAKVIIDILESSDISVFDIFDDNPTVTEIYGKKVSGKYFGQPLDAPVIISIGDNAIRSKISKTLQVPFGTAIHTSAIISPSAKIETGTVVMQGAIIQADTFIGKHAIINTGASIDHDCIVGAFAHISPGAILCGGVQIGEGTHIGAGAVILPSIKIGKWCKIGAGAVVSKSIPSNCTAVGVPAKPIKYHD